MTGFPYRQSRPLRGWAAPAMLLAGLGASPLAAASEGGMGRPITGMQVQPYSGIIPPTPGMQWELGYVHYDGKIGASRSAPIAGQISLGLNANVDLYLATGIYVWPTGEGHWNFASMLTLSYIDLTVDATLGLGPLSYSTSQSTSAPFDVYFAPVIAGYHFSQVSHMSMGLYIYAPTASYDPARLANAGLNIWTVSPTIDYTHLYQKGTLEFTVQGAVDWYSKNDDTDYKNGMVWRSEVLLIKRTASGWGFGGVAGWIYQLQDDEGPTADMLGGFKGRSFGAGPVITYSKKWPDGKHVDVAFRYVDEFSSTNRLKGQPLSLLVSF